MEKNDQGIGLPGIHVRRAKQAIRQSIRTMNKDMLFEGGIRLGQSRACAEHHEYNKYRYDEFVFSWAHWGHRALC
jgi:hypothetical protein